MNNFAGNDFGSPNGTLKPGHVQHDSSPLIYLSAKDALTVKQSYEGIFVTGQTGSGKTTGPLQAIFRAWCRQGFGILATTTKVSDEATYASWAKAEGRENDLLFFSPEQKSLRIGLLSYAFHQNGARGGGDTDNVVHLLSELLEFKNRGRPQNSNSDVFWYEYARKLLSHLIDLLAYANECISFENIYRVLQSVGHSVEEVQSKEWQERSFLNQCVDKAVGKGTLATFQQNDLALAIEFFLSAFVRLDEKVRSGVIATLDSIVYCFVRGRLAEMCGGAETTFTPEDTFRGKILILSTPVHEFKLTGQLIQVLFLRLWQQAAERRDLKVYPRGLGLICDECQHFISPRSFALFQATARSMRVSTCLATQSLGALETQLSKTDAQSLIANFNLKCFCASDDSPTNTWAARMIGEEWGLTGNTNVSLAGEGGASGGVSEHKKFLVEPSEFVRLRKGGEDNNFLVDTIAFRSGRPFEATKMNHIRVRFPQKIVP